MDNQNNLINLFGTLAEQLRHSNRKDLLKELERFQGYKKLYSKDLNEIEEPGFYFISTNDEVTNFPAANGTTTRQAGWLLVLSDTTAENDKLNYRILQLFFKVNTSETYSTSAYIRRKVATTLESGEVAADWNVWEDFPNSRNAFMCHSLIAEGVNLDTITTPGYYYLSSVRKYINTPTCYTDEGGILLVYNDLKANGEPTVASNTRLYQLLLTNGGASTIAIRHKVSPNLFSTWTITANAEQVENKLDVYSGVKKQDLFEYVDGNLFDGNWIAGAAIRGIANSELPLTLKPDPKYQYLGIISVKPNTTYTVFHGNPHYEPYWQDASKNYCYFAAVTATHLLTIGDIFDGEVSYKRTNLGNDTTITYTFVTGSNDHYLYIQGGYNYGYDSNEANSVPKDNGPYVKVIEGTSKESISLNGEAYDKGDRATFRLKDEYAPKLVTNIVDTTVITGGLAKQNLFNGMFSENLWVGSSASYSGASLGVNSLKALNSKSNLNLKYEVGYKGTAIIAVEANTVYSIIKESTGLEAFSSGQFFSVLKMFQTEADLSTLFAAIADNDTDAMKKAIAEVKPYLGETINGIADSGYVTENVTVSDGQNTTTETIYYPCICSYTGITSKNNFTFKTGPNVKYIILSVAKEIQPLVQVVKGIQENLTVDSYEEINGLSYSTGRVNAARRARGQLNFYKWYDKDPNFNNKSPYTGEYTCPYMVVTNGRNTYTFLHEKQGTDEDRINKINTWRWYNHKIDGDTRYTDTEDDIDNNTKLYKDSATCLWSGTDSEGVISIEDVPDHIGGFHNGEYITSMTVLIDGTRLIADDADSNNIDKLDKLTYIKHGCKNITFIIESEIRLHGEQTWNDGLDLDPSLWNKPIFIRTKKIEITHTKVKVSNTWKAVEDTVKAAAALTTTLKVKRSLLGGLYSVRKNFLNGFSDNVTKKFYPALRRTKINDSSYRQNSLAEDYARDEVTFYGNKDFVLTVRSLVNKDQYGAEENSPKYRGSVCDFDSTTLNQDRYKVYFEDIGTANKLEITSDTTLTGCFEIETLTDDLNFIENV